MFSLIEARYLLEGRYYVGYGIQYGDICIPDITTNKSRLEKFIELCNKLELSPLHIKDIALDFVNDCY